MDITSSRSFIVTGGASGLGGAVTQALIAKGAHVVIADLKGQAIEGATFIETDVTNEDQVQAAVDAAQEHGELSGLVNCAGIGPAAKTTGGRGPFPLDLFRKTIEVNLIGTFNAIRLAATAMANNEPGPSGERGVIINTASVAAYEGQIGQAAYSASKAGLVGLTLPVARDLAELGIRVNTIAPGTFHTPLLDSFSEEVRASLAEQVPFPSRLGDPDEFAALALHIVENQMLNAETIRLDGAIRMQPA